MKKNRSIIFFDIDGTIIDEESNTIPDSTKKAIKLLKENGHIPIINTGRTSAILPTSIKEIGFSGYILGCGTTIILEDNELMHFDVGIENSKIIIDDFKKFNLDGLGEGKLFNYFPNKEYLKHPVAIKIVNSINEFNYPLLPLETTLDVNLQKFVIFIHNSSDFNGFYEKHKNNYDFIKRSNDFYEVVPIGYSKATGIEYLTKHLEIPMENTFAIGDSSNDIPMFEFANTSIAMGNSSKEILEIADYVTTDILNDGIYNALRHFDLI